MLEAVWLALLLPLAGFGVNALLGAWLPRRTHGPVAVVAMGGAFAAALAVLAGLLALPADDRRRDLVLYHWVVTGGFDAPVGAWIDPLAALMLLIVTGVGFLIHLYALEYMRDDDGERRFFALLNLFVFAMLVLVLADNFMLLLVGWGGVGFASYALISHYFTRPDAVAAGVKAFVVNTLGDVGMMLGIFLIWLTFGAVDFARVFGAAPARLTQDPAATSTATAIALLLLVGAVAKSGQVPLHVWLPDAMAGPTPVSALIHAATMVTAGVYLLARAWPLYEQAPFALAVVAGIGAFTALFGATIGLVQSNIKRVLAFSTISQLGYMFLAAGLGAYGSAIFHLFTHAFFKALLFLAAGVVIHALAGEEDLLKMGGLRRALPAAHVAFLIGALAIAGIPPFAGFFSKDEIVYNAFFGARGNVVLGSVALITGGLTAFYVFRAYFLTFYGRPAQERTAHLHSPGLAMTLPLAALGLLSVVGGWVMIPGLVGTFEHFLEPVFQFPAGQHAGAAVAGGSSYWGIAFVSTLFSVVGIAAAYTRYGRPERAATSPMSELTGLRRVLANRYYVDEVYSAVLVRPFFGVASFVSNHFDRAVGAIVNGVGLTLREASQGLRDLQNGYLRNYALVILGGAVLLIAYVLVYAGA